MKNSRRICSDEEGLLSAVSLKAKLFLAAFGVILALGWLGAVAFTQIQVIRGENQESAKFSRLIHSAQDVRFHAIQVQQFITDAALTGDEEVLKQAEEHLQAAKSKIEIIPSNLIPTLARDIQTQFEVGQEMFQAYQKGGRAAGNVIMKRPETGLDDRSLLVAKAVDSLIETLAKEVDVSLEHVEQAERQAWIWLAVACVISGLILSFLFYVIYRAVRPIDEVNAELSKSARELEAVSISIDSSSVKLRDATAQQSSAQRQVAASVEQITSMVAMTAQNAEDLQEGAKSSRTSASQGQEAMVEMRSSMQSISESSTKIKSQVDESNQKLAEIVQTIHMIGEKTKVINDIVFQTKLLSFNASVEAARAGEQGKGFAVVAEEVGALAQMSGKAAMEIREMLDVGTQTVNRIVEESRTGISACVQESFLRIETGSRVTERCDLALQEILRQNGSMASKASEMAQAIREQRTGIEEIAKAMAVMSSSMNINESNSDETAKAAGILLDHSRKFQANAHRLEQIVLGETAAALSASRA